MTEEEQDRLITKWVKDFQEKTRGITDVPKILQIQKDTCPIELFKDQIKINIA